MKEKHVKLGKDLLAEKLAKLHEVDKEIKALDGHLRKKGFRPQKEKKNYWGIKSTYEDKDKKADFSIMVQDYFKPKSKDGAAIGQIEVTAGGRTEVYSFDLIAPGGDVKKAKEYRVDKNLKVLEAESWWDCVVAELVKSIPDIFIEITKCTVTALVSGPFSWASFLTCIALAFGVPFVKASACCGCNCQWWCAWAVGCCRA